MTLVKQTSTSSAGKVSDGCNASGRPQGAPFQLAGGVEPPTDRPVANGDSRERRAMEVLPRRVSKSPSPPTQASSTLPLPPKTINSATSTLPARKTPSEDQGKRPGQHASLPSAPSALRMDRPRVRAVFSHAGGKNETLLSFKVDEIIKLLVPEAKDGWHYGESEVTNEKGWFPYSYTKPLCEVSTERQALSNLQASKFNSVSTGRLDEVGASSGSEVGCYVRKGNSSFPASGVVRPRPFSMMNPDLSQLSGDLTVTGNRSPRSNPFTNVRLKRTVTNDRSAPALR
ncbi:brain-specific angiogenesis inhibitor 1-associated protein 2-like [Scyliorhinus canicula]|uniref:brain-specific angiogenesis inhibitor 1-associated protein 2-like n=1 Tax=Scyliorhinus canicula TaxID=7830 RepID=UPI0018F591E1|nr:brain-specific angiogenesis inhibitor 1-associated protein 2-like [Scyliorhinus canicula]